MQFCYCYIQSDAQNDVQKSVESHVMKRDNVFYYVRHIPKDLIDHYNVKNYVSV